MNNIEERKDYLRERATRFLAINAEAGLDISALDAAKLIAELQVHQIELEIQNEDLRLANENTRRIQEKYIDLYDFSPTGYLSLRGKEKIFEANLAAAELLGIERSLLLYNSFTDFVDSDFQDIFYFYSRKVRKSGLRESCELKLRKFSGETFFARLESMAIHKGQGTPVEVRVSLTNIHASMLNAIALKESAERNEMLLNLLPQPAFLIDSRRKVLAANRLAKKYGAAVGEFWTQNLQNGQNGSDTVAGGNIGFSGQKELQSASCLVDDNHHQQRLVTVVEDSNDAISLLDLQGNIKAWNRKAEELYGYSASEALKMTVFELVPPGLKPATRQLLSDIRAGAIIKSFETRRIAKDGTVLDIFLKITRLVQGSDIVAITTTERDISDHNRLFASLQELPGRIIRAQEKERGRISQVLHSEFGQSLVALKLFMAVSASEFSATDSKVKPIFTLIKARLDKIIDDTRRLAHELSPPGLKYVGLVPAINALIDSAMMEKHLKINFFHSNLDKACFKDNDIIVYRIFQEALRNILKHSQATLVRVKAVVKHSLFTVEISDNGKGFDTAMLIARKGLGLALMKEQATLMLGTFKIQSRVGKGTSIKISVPVKEQKLL